MEIMKVLYNVDEKLLRWLNKGGIIGYDSYSGIKGESYARKIENGIVDCRDVLSALLHPPVTGYAYSDYYEKNLVKALTYLKIKM